jgi:DNA-binding GntR family transcriptional regulator
MQMLDRPDRTPEDAAPLFEATLTSQVYQRLRADILEGKLKPGQKLKVEALRSELRAGASPIREALSLLTSEGFVARIDNRGFRAAPVSLSDFDDLQSARCWVEERALRESIAAGRADWEDRVVLARHRLSRTPRMSTISGATVSNPAWEAAHKRFHISLLEACGSATVLRICDQLYDRATRYRNLAISLSDQTRDANREHAAIADAALNRDADLACGRLLEHYRRTGNILRKALHP